MPDHRIVLGESKKLTCLMGCKIKTIRPKIKTETLIYRSKGKILFWKVTHHLDPEISKLPVNYMFGNEDFTVHSVPPFTCYQKKNSASKTDNVNLNGR